MTQFSIPVIEYHCPRPGQVISPPHPNFCLNDRQLVVAMVRSILTVNPGRTSRHFTAVIVWPTMRFMLDWNCVPNLRVSSNFSRVLRDFSITSRIGELAQGVSYAYWKWQRGYSWITDFGPWVAGLNPSYVGTKSPDFVMLNMQLNDLAVMESKGTGTHCHKKLMGAALRQCKDAIGHQAFSRGFGNVLVLDSSNAAGVGTLYIRDPVSKGELTDEMKYFIFRRSYASWFDLTGDDELAAWCRGRMSKIDDRNDIRQRLAQNGQQPNSPLRAMTATALGFEPTATRFALDPTIANAIISLESFKRTDWSSFFQMPRVTDEEGHRSLRFPDGTIIEES